MFSPQSGDFLVSLGHDDRIKVFKEVRATLASGDAELKQRSLRALARVGREEGKVPLCAHGVASPAVRCWPTTTTRAAG